MNDKETKTMDLESFHPQGEQIDQLIEQALDAGFEAEKGRKPKNADERRTWLRDENGAQVLNAVPPVAFAAQVIPGTNLEDASAFLSPSVEISPVVNPLFHALMVKLGAKPNGPRTYEVSAGKGKTASERQQIVTALKAILEVLPGAVCYAPNCVEQGEKKGFASWNISRYKVFRDIYYLIRDTAAGEQVGRATLNSMTHDHPTAATVAAAREAGEDTGRLSPLRGAAIVLSANRGRIFIRVCTNRADENGLRLCGEAGMPDLDRLRPGGRLDPQAVTPDRAVALMDAAAAQGYEVVDPSGDLALLRQMLSKMTLAQRVPGAPGQSRLVVGGEVEAQLGEAEQRLPERSADQAVRVATVPAGAAGIAVQQAEKAGAVAALDPCVADVIRMSHAEPVAPDAPDADLTLRDYQREAVGLHLATEVGYLQACSVGLGKTAITLRGMRAWAEKKAEAA